MALKMKTQHGAAGLSHKACAGFGRAVDHIHRRTRQSGEYACGAVLHVGVDSLAESILRSLHEVASATAVAVDLHSAGHNVHPFGVKQLGADHRQITVGHFKHLVVAHQHAAILKPSLWRQDFCIDYLSKHVMIGIKPQI